MTERLILYNNDDCNLFGILCYGETDPAEMKTILEEQVIDKLAGAGVDIFSVCLWDRFRCVGRSQVVEPLVCTVEDYRFFPDWSPLYQMGYDPVQIMLARCRQRGLKFVAGMRMNDRHDDSRFPKGRFVVEHPEWQLRGDPTPEGSRPYGTRVDYSYEPVRREVLAYIKDMLATYEVDGVEFDYMRACHMFRPGTGAQNALKLTEFTRKTRQLMDAAARSRGRGKLLLGVRVPPSLPECRYLGYDVEAWVQEGLVDYVCPSHYVRTEINTPVEQFAELVQGTTCKVYPSIHPTSGFGMVPFLARGTKADVTESLASYRAAAHNFYQFGADGLQTYNYQQMAPGYGARPEHYATDQWSEALGWLTELRDPALVAEGDRHYAFHTLWWPDDRGVEGECLGKNEFGFPYTSPIIRLDCIHWASHLHGAVRFRLAEDLTRANLTATLRFKAVGLAEEDALQIELNGFEISDDCVTRPRHTFDDLQFYQYSLDMHREAVAPIVAKGDNQLALRLLSNRSENGGAVTVGDLEVSVSVRGV